jgi:shikimate dehydrogenase
VNRTAATAHRAAALADAARVGDQSDIAGADLLVNATSVGMGSDDTPVDATLLHAGLVVADVVYHPLTTRLLRDAAAAGSRTIDGLGMLVHQAAHQQRLWTGTSPDPSMMRAAAEAALAVRSDR